MSQIRYRQPEDFYTKPSPTDRWAEQRARLAQFDPVIARANRGEPPTNEVGKKLEAMFGGR